jgi:N-acetylneuraminic acid mutarotase
MKKTTTILAILFATVFSVNAQNYYPEPRTGHTMTLIGNYIYMYGGETQAKQAKEYFINDLARFETSQNEWSYVQPSNTPPDSRQGHSAVAHEGNLYIIGGQTANGMSGEIWKYNTATNTWEQLNTSGSNIPGRMQHGAFVEDGVLYIVGGSDGTNQLQDAYSVNLNDGTTTALPNIPGTSGINGMSVFNNNGSPVVAGGQNSTGINSSVYMLNLNPVAYWGVIFGNSQGLAFPGTAIIPDAQYVCGGIVSNGKKSTEEYSSKLYRVSFSGNNINYDEITDNIPADTYFNRFVVSFEESENKSAIDTVFYFWGGATDDSFYKYTLYGDESEETIEIYNPETGNFKEITTNVLLNKC